MKFLKAQYFAPRNQYSFLPVLKLNFQMQPGRLEFIQNLTQELIVFVTQEEKLNRSEDRCESIEVDILKQLGQLLLRIQGLRILDEADLIKVNKEENGEWILIFPCFSRKVVSHIAQASLELLNKVNAQEVELANIKKYLLRWYQKLRVDFQTRDMLRAALKLKIPFFRLSENSHWFCLGESMKVRVYRTLTSDTSNHAIMLANNKPLVNELLVNHGFPVPKQWCVSGHAELAYIEKELSYPLVVKPANCDKGVGVMTKIRNISELSEAVKKCRKLSKKIVIEKTLLGREYRVTVAGSKVLGVVERQFPSVVGDGQKTIQNLVDKINLDREDDFENHKLMKILFNEAVLTYLAKQNLTPESIPELNQRIILNEVKNLSQGGSVTCVTERVHPDNLKMFAEAIQLIGLNIAGIDFITENIEKSFNEVECGIIDINSVPGFNAHYSAEGNTIDVAVETIKELYPQLISK